MAKPYLIIFSMLIILGSSYNYLTAQTSKKTKSSIIQLTKRHTQRKTDVFKELTAQDRKNYLLIIDQRKIGKLHDTILYRGKCKVFNVPVKLSNISNDTLRYLSMSCSWDESFSIDNKNLNILVWGCDKNVPVDKLVLPHNSVVYNIPVLTDGTIESNKFRIGMNLLIVNKKNKRFTWDLILSDYKTKNLIWSNPVTVR